MTPCDADRPRQSLEIFRQEAGQVFGQGDP
jgi:hypothetical protein